MKTNLENIKEYTTKASLTSDEKFDMFQNIQAYSTQNPIRSNYSIFMKHSFLYASMFTILIGTSATSFAAQGSLPGDILYPIKTNVNEEVIKTLSLTQNQKARTHIELVDERMSELTEMIVTKKDTPDKIAVIREKLTEHKKDFDETVSNIDQNTPEETLEVDEIYSTLESVIDTHIDIIEEITDVKEPSEQDTLPQATSTPDVTQELAPESETEIKEEVDNDSISISELKSFSITQATSTKKVLSDINLQIQKDIRKKIIEETEYDLKIDILLESE